jgi:hypothetical protein
MGSVTTRGGFGLVRIYFAIGDITAAQITVTKTTWRLALASSRLRTWSSLTGCWVEFCRESVLTD